ncbi:MAG TPA: FIST N-terminal domain-containing protein [Melioribacteraceae bacterium]|nr:FIST N-terminal domain-containing protein [Melioribacteraceae bacterium]
MKNKIFFTSEPKEYKALAEIYSNLHTDNISELILFISENYNFDMISAGIGKLFNNIKVFACSTQTLIYKNEFNSSGILAINIDNELSNCEIIYFNNSDENITNKVELLSLGFKSKNTDFYKNPGKYFGIFFTNNNKNNLHYLLSEYLYPIDIIEIIPSSAKSSPLLFNGLNFSSENSALLLFNINTPFVNFNFNSFYCSKDPLVVTQCDEANCIVYELDTEKAVSKYLELTGYDLNTFNKINFSQSPLIIKYGNNYIPKVIKRIHEDDLSLEFYESIELGTIFRMGVSKDINQNTKELFDNLINQFGFPNLTLFFDSIFRLEIVDNKAEYLETIKKNNCVGISTVSVNIKGEQLNNTATGIAFFD